MIFAYYIVCYRAYLIESSHQRWATPVSPGSDSDSRPTSWLRFRLHLSKNWCLTPVPTPTPNCQKTESIPAVTLTTESESPIFGSHGTIGGTRRNTDSLDCLDLGVCGWVSRNSNTVPLCVSVRNIRHSRMSIWLNKNGSRRKEEKVYILRLQKRNWREKCNWRKLMFCCEPSHLDKASDNWSWKLL